MQPVAAVILSVSLLAACQSQASCLRYGTNTVTGTIVLQTHAGPPDYQSVSDGDEPRVVWVLLLDRFICVVDPASRAPNEYEEREIQLVVDEVQRERYREWLGKPVAVTGELRHGHADYKRLLLVPRGIKRRSK